MSKKSFVSPISIDLGARNTGVFFAHYETGSSLQGIEKEGRVYQLEKDSYTLLMANRTATRHQRRGFDRRQMVKRLFRLIWCQHFKLPWNDIIQQSVGFLLNRRGFSFLTEEYDAEVLSRFPKEAYDRLPDVLKDALKTASNENGEYDFASVLTEQANKGGDDIKSWLDAIDEEPKRIRRRLVLIGKTKKLKEYCIQRKDGQKIHDEEKKKANLSRLSKWMLEGWDQEGVQGLPPIPSGNSVDMVAHLNTEETVTAEEILNSLPDHTSEEKELKKSVWRFRTEKFDSEKVDFSIGEKPNICSHLHHIAFALHKIHEELTSGGRHRSKYFEEIKSVLTHQEHSHGYLKTFCTKLHEGDFRPIDVEKLTNLIGHLSNLELKPLRKYFNNEKHKEADYWNESCLKKIFDRWILHEWRVNLEKDKDKAEDKKGDYKKLCRDWKARQGTVVDFWLKTDPFCTIPPYQDNNNRRPPRCQSLILNPPFLDNRYPEWQNWLEDLRDLETVQDHLGSFEKEMIEVKSSNKKGMSYFSDSDEAKGEPKKDSGRRTRKDLNARLLQFIFDRVKADDPLNLNEIYSHTKKYRQQQSTTQEKDRAKEQLEKAVADSELPDILKAPRDYDDVIFAENRFLHLVCKYYKLRQKARAGRVFIHPEYRFVKGRGYENTGRFDDANHLLTYCNHKPRQKRYQMLKDIAGLLQISPKQLEQSVQQEKGQTTDDKLCNWLDGIKGLSANCDRAAKEQKDRRGRLKVDIQSIFSLIDRRKEGESPSSREIKTILKHSSVKDAFKLYCFCVKARELCLITTQSLHAVSRQQELEKNPSASVYLLAQIHNIAFTERSGNAKTCAVCSTDNAQRMQTVVSADGKESHAKAQRLPAIETRLIDGAVRRMARIVGGAIAEDKWRKIKGKLEAGNPVRVPIITESNRFEFEPSKEELVKSQRPKQRKGKPLDRGGAEDIAKAKEQRLKESGHDICPYTGESVGANGQIDHIIPRSSKWGTLNDEANLIWASCEGNHHKTNTKLSLADLKQGYKDAQFNDKKDDEIVVWIENQIGKGEGERFTFGPYRSFINLTAYEQKAFRHALFLVGHSLREKVINAINNRNRALVNGTQRYFAEVLANNLYKEAKKIGRQHLLSFDYFGAEAQDSSRGEGIYRLRKKFECADTEIKKYRKVDGETQELYSHLIDAQLAFAIVADEHRNEGGLKLKIDAAVSLWPDNRTAAHTIFDAIRVAPGDMPERKLQRGKPASNYFRHRSIHRDNMYAEHYVPILVSKERGEVRVGFDWNNSYLLKETNANRIKLYFALQFSPMVNSLALTEDISFHELAKQLANVGFNSKAGYFYVPLRVQAIHAYYIENYNTSKGYQEYSAQMEFLRSLAYRTEKKRITTLQEAEKIVGKEDRFQMRKLVLPIKAEWQRLVDAWRETDLEDAAFLRQFFEVSDKKQSHEKVRKVFSLPIKTGEGKILLKRSSWNGKDIFQIVNDSDSRRVDAKVFIPVFVKSEGKIGRLLSQSARSEGVFLLSENDNERYYNRLDSNVAIIDPKRWHLIETKETRKELRELGIGGLAYRIDNNTRPQIRLTFYDTPQQKNIDALATHVLLKPKDKANLQSKLQEVGEQGRHVEYTGARFSRDVNQVLLPVLAASYQ